jgi:sulfur transfer protein SufE/stress-induced morphogen
MKFHTLALLSLALLSSSCGGVAAFIIMAPSTPSSRRLHSTLTSQLRLSNPPQDSTTTTNSNAILQSLTPELLKMTLAFRDIGDDKLRYKQLLYMATHQLPPLQHPEQVMIAANKVPGCLSTVYVDGTATYSKEKQDYVVDFVGESDGLLTKGLVALLVRGLSGCTQEEIARVSPEFIKEAGISQSLTPGRNNGFLNMLNSMKQKAKQLVEEAEATAAKESNHDDCKDAEQEQQQEDETSFGGGPIYNSIMASLQQLQPTFVKLVDTSHQHAGHAGVKGTKNGGESHFELTIVANAFEGLNLVKRHQLVYMILGKEMQQIHALNIKANTPNEASGR